MRGSGASDKLGNAPIPSVVATKGHGLEEDLGRVNLVHRTLFFEHAVRG